MTQESAARGEDGRTRLSEQLGQQLQRALDRAGMTQAELARAMGLSAKHVNQMVSGKSGAWAMFDYAAFVLDCEWTVELVLVSGGSARPS